MAHAAEPIDPCELQSIAVLSEQTKTLPCNARQITELVLNGTQTVPNRIYHYGQYRHMMENVKNRTVSQKAWDKYIMGDITRYELGSTRRGLYGTAGIDTNSFSTSKYNWLTEIHIDPKCTAPERVVTIRNLKRDDRFLRWYKKTKMWKTMKLTRFKENCSDPGYQGFSSKTCRKIVLQFLNDQDIKVIHDHEIDKSFYIRDRSCIKTIKGSPTEIIEMFANIDFLWQNICEGSIRRRESIDSRIAYMMLRGLTDSEKELPAIYYDKLIKQIQAVNFSSPRIDQDAFVKAVELHQKCAQNLKHNAFQNALSTYISDHINKKRYPAGVYYEDRSAYDRSIRGIFDTKLATLSKSCEKD